MQVGFHSSPLLLNISRLVQYCVLGHDKVRKVCDELMLVLSLVLVLVMVLSLSLLSFFMFILILVLMLLLILMLTSLLLFLMSTASDGWDKV